MTGKKPEGGSLGGWYKIRGGRFLIFDFSNAIHRRYTLYSRGVGMVRLSDFHSYESSLLYTISASKIYTSALPYSTRYVTVTYDLIVDQKLLLNLIGYLYPFKQVKSKSII